MPSETLDGSTDGDYFDAPATGRLAAAQTWFGGSVSVSEPFPGRPPLWVEPKDEELSTDIIMVQRWMAEHLGAIESALLEYGAILWRSFPVADSDDFAAMMCEFESFSKGYTAGTSERKAIKGKVMESTRTPASTYILLHQEMSYLPVHPRLVAFFCKLPAPVAGETVISDMRGALEALPEALQRRFVEQGVLYRRNLRNDDVDDWRAVPEYRHFSWQYWFESGDRNKVTALLDERGVIYEWLDDGSLSIWTHRPGVLAHPVTGEILLFNQLYAQMLHRVAVGDERADLMDDAYGTSTPRPYSVVFGNGERPDEATFFTLHEEFQRRCVKFEWRAGDVMLVENRLTAHGRLPFSGPREVQVMLFE